MKKIRLGYDLNLNLPSDFSKEINCETQATRELQELIDAFEKKELDLIFIPVGTLPYMKQYQIVSQAILNAKNTMFTHFITTKSITIENLERYHLGRVNQYCTTSYWAPLTYLMSYLKSGTKLNFKDFGSFQNLLKNTAQATIDASSMWNIIMEQDPASTAKVKTIFSIENLPTPVLVANTNLDASLIKQINQFKTTDEKSFFEGFSAPQMSAIENFLAKIQAALRFYNIAI